MRANKEANDRDRKKRNDLLSSNQEDTGVAEDDLDDNINEILKQKVDIPASLDSARGTDSQSIMSSRVAAEPQQELTIATYLAEYQQAPKKKISYEKDI